MGKISGGRGGRATTKFGAVPTPSASDPPSATVPVKNRGQEKSSEEDRLRLAPAVENDIEDTPSSAVPVKNRGKEKSSKEDSLRLAPAVSNDDDNDANDTPILNGAAVPNKDRDNNEHAGVEEVVHDNVEGADDPVNDIEQPSIAREEGEEEEATLVLEGVLAPSPSPGDGILVVEGQLRPTKEEEEKVARRQSRYLIGMLVWILSGVALVLILTFTLREQEPETIVRDTSNEANFPPSMAPTAPERNFELEQQVIQMLQPWLDEEALQQSPSSPEAKALHWIVYEDEYLSLETRLEQIQAEDLLQRFSLVAFYYSTGGDLTWRRQSKFLTSDEHECDWNEEQNIDFPENQLLNDGFTTFFAGALSPIQGVFAKAIARDTLQPLFLK